MEFVQVACDIHRETVNFLTRLSARYQRLLADGIIRLADEVAENAIKANATFPSDDVAKALRREYLLKAKSSLQALDYKLSFAYEVMLLNPQGCFTSAKRTIPENEAIKKLDNMAQSLGEKIYREESLLVGTIKKDKSRT